MTKAVKSICIIIIMLILISIFVFAPTKVYAQDVSEIKVATGVIDPNDFKPPALTDDDTKPITDKASTITNVIGIIGVVVSVIALILIGIKIMLGSVEEKAEYKKIMIQYLIGVLIFFALMQLLSIIIKVVEGFNT